eukprot:UC1_evm1s756
MMRVILSALCLAAVATTCVRADTCKDLTDQTAFTTSMGTCAATLGIDSAGCYANDPAGWANIQLEMLKMSLDNLDNEQAQVDKLTTLYEPQKGCLCPVITTFTECLTNAFGSFCIDVSTQATVETIIGKSAMYFTGLCDGVGKKSHSTVFCFDIPNFKEFSAEQAKTTCEAFKTARTALKPDCTNGVSVPATNPCGEGKTAIQVKSEPSFSSPPVAKFSNVTITYTNSSDAAASKTAAPSS